MSCRGTETLLVASYLEAEHVERIRSAWDGPVLYEPDLLPVPQYASDHTGTPRALTSDQMRQWRGLLGRAEISFGFDWWAPADMLRNCGRLRWLQATSSGIGGVLQRTGLADADVVFTTAAGVHAVPLAEFAVAGVLHLIKGVRELLARQHAHRWIRYSGSLLAGRRVGVVGLGAVGRRIVSVFHALGAVVVGVGRPGREYALPAGVVLADTTTLDEVLRDCDVLVLSCPLTQQTYHLLDGTRLALLPRTAIVVNVSRGSVIEEPALVEALGSGRLAGAVLDVFEAEPLPVDSPLWDMDNVVVSPHSASTVGSENAALTDLFIDNLTRWRDGRPLRNVYCHAAGY